MELIPLTELKGESKMSRLKQKPDPERPRLRKPEWIRIDARTNAKNVANVKKQLRSTKLHTVCEEASCPNLGECFSKRTATFMVMGAICTRRCPFCDVAHGKPMQLDAEEPLHVAESTRDLGLRYVVITSVDRDDLRDGGADHFAQVVRETRKMNPGVKVEILVPDFRGKLDLALENLKEHTPDVLNHNMETVPSMYDRVRPGASYENSLNLLRRYKEMHPEVTTKSGLMVGLGETEEEMIQVMKDLRAQDVGMLTIGQYLQPTKHHLAVEEYVTPEQFKRYEELGYELGFENVASGPMVRSSYHADIQASHSTVEQFSPEKAD